MQRAIFGVVSQPSKSKSVVLLPSLHSWYDASDASTIISSGGRVSQWSDKSGNNRHATQSNGSYQPYIGSNTQNGLNVITFNAATNNANFLSASASITTNTFTFFSVYRKFGATNSSSIYSRILSLYNSPSGTDYLGTDGFVIGVSDTSYLGASIPDAFGYHNGAPIAAYHVNYDTSYLTNAILNAGSFSITTSGNTVSGSTTSTNLNANALSLGTSFGNTGGDSQMNGWFAEHILYTTVLTQAQITAIQNYLSAKWGV